ncbi:MAG: PP2C family protein-serine/threonine phosphatase [Terriglobales bacterium]
MSWNDRRRRRMGFWRNLSPGAFAMFLAAAFCLFASFGFIGNIGATVPWTGALEAAMYSGIIGTGFAWLGTRENYPWMIVWALAVFVGWPSLHDWLWPPRSGNFYTLPAGFASVSAIVVVVLGYVLFLLFVGTEGRRHVRLETEVNLAGEIHRALAPAVDRQLGRYQFCGTSRASGQVGGDLLDVIESDSGWLAYIADVAGHGVSAGVLMGVVKSAVRTWLAARGGECADLVPGLNAVLASLLPPESYVTAAILMPSDGGLRYAAAGHPPLLHWHAATGEVTPIQVENFPLGMFAHASFASVPLVCAPGDVLALFTDGLVEIFDHGQREFGLDGLAAVLRQASQRPLPELVQTMTAAARSFGPQTDDQTLLLVRAH